MLPLGWIIVGLFIVNTIIIFAIIGYLRGRKKGYSEGYNDGYDDGETWEG